MTSPQPPVPTASANDVIHNSTSHRRGSDVERIAPQPQEPDDEEGPHSDATIEAELEQAAQSIDETDVLSMGGPDSLEDGGDSAGVDDSRP